MKAVCVLTGTEINWPCAARRLDQSTGEYDEDFYLECSECKRKVWDIDQGLAVLGQFGKLVEQYPYCHCGAKMDGGQA